MRTLLAVAATVGISVCGAQETAPKTEGARDLFFVGAAPKDELPAIRKAPATQAKAPAAAPKAATHLGVRYTLLLVKSRDGRGEPVDPTHRFQKGDCVAVEIESNRSGYLYVLAKESGGDWTPLFPSPEAAVQDNKIDPGQTVRTPRQSCFEIEDPPGTETVFVVLSREPRDISQLADSIKAPAARVNSAVQQMATDFGTRDLPFQEVAKPATANAARKEPPHAVYVVNGSPKPQPTLVTKIELNHQ
jgi:hypothetical protein